MRRAFLFCAVLAGCGSDSSLDEGTSDASPDASLHGEADAGSGGATFPDATVDASSDLDAAPVEAGPAGATDGSADAGDASPAASLPAAVLAAGYLTNTFSTTSWSTANVDTKNTKKTGFDWYPYEINGASTDLTKIVPGGTSITLAGDTTGPNGEIITAQPTGGTSFVGTAFGGGAYFEAVMKFDPADVIAQDTKGWPSFWAVPIERLLDLPDTWWNGDPSTNFDNHVELDIFEYLVPKQDKGDDYGGTMHNWYGTYQVTCGPPPATPYCDWHTPTSTNTRTVPAGTDFTRYHSIGLLWVPATATTKGSATFYFDRNVMGAVTTWSKWTDSPEPTAADAKDASQPSWALSWLDETHYLLILGTGVKEPLTVESVDVWQASAAANLHH
jgi:hypothetical protein